MNFIFNFIFFSHPLSSWPSSAPSLSLFLPSSRICSLYQWNSLFTATQTQLQQDLGEEWIRAFFSLCWQISEEISPQTVCNSSTFHFNLIPKVPSIQTHVFIFVFLQVIHEDTNKVPLDFYFIRINATDLAHLYGSFPIE